MAWLDCSAQTGSDFKSSGWTQEEFVAHVAKVASLISKQHRAEKVGVCDAPNTHPYVLEAYRGAKLTWVGKVHFWLYNHALLGVGNYNLLQCSCLENSINRGAWRAIVHGVTHTFCKVYFSKHSIV